MVPVLRTYRPCATSASPKSGKALIRNIFGELRKACSAEFARCGGLSR
jgi:hypothetical protein